MGSGLRDAGRTRHLAEGETDGTDARAGCGARHWSDGPRDGSQCFAAPGIPTVVWNRTAEATRDLAELGAEVAGTAADAARRAAIVVTMVTDADAVLSVARDQGMLAALAPGAIWAQMSTIGVAGTDRVTAMAGAQRPDVMLLDAPVSGKQGSGRTRPADDLRVRSWRGASRVWTPLFDALGQRTIWAR